jgi:hypothetical protein
VEITTATRVIREHKLRVAGVAAVVAAVVAAAVAAAANCSMRSVRLAAHRLGCLSAQSPVVRSTAAIAIPIGLLASTSG